MESDRENDANDADSNNLSALQTAEKELAPIIRYLQATEENRLDQFAIQGGSCIECKTMQQKE